MPETLSGLSCAAGFIAAAALLHAAGIGLGLLIGAAGQRSGHRITQWAGRSTAIAGIVMLGGVL